MNTLKKVLWVIGVAVVVALVAFFIVVPLTGSATTSASGDENGDKTTLSEEDRAAIAKLLTVTTTSADVECVTDDYGLVQYQIGALEAVPDPRKWSDGISTPITATEAEAARDELQVAICKDPLLGVSYLVFLATDARDAILASTGIDILEINTWLKPYAVDPSEINTLAAEFIPLLDVEKEPTKEEIDEAMEQNKSWKVTADKANTLLDRFAVTGIEARQSIVNYHLAAGGLVAGGLPAVERNGNEEDLPALILSLTEKDQCEPLLEIGANVGDKRPELFETKVCETPSTPETPNTPDTPDCTTPCGPPPVTECPPGQVGTPPNCLVPKSSDPKDYEYPTDKPKVTVDGPADTKKPEVKTEQNGGGGVVDTPTNNSGSETGVQAPNTTPAPTTPTNPSTNLGGDNGGGDPGGF